MRKYITPNARVVEIDAESNLMESSYFVDGPDVGGEPTGTFDTRKQRTIWEYWTDEE